MADDDQETVARPNPNPITHPKSLLKRHVDVQKDKTIDLHNIPLTERFILLFKPIYRIKTIDEKSDDAKTQIIIVPEAFRMLFYAAFMGFLALGYVITSSSGNLDLDSNPIIDRFGTNNMCIYFDEKPFIYISSFLYIFLLMILLAYEATEWYRVFDAWRDDKLIRTCTYVLYCICSTLEIISYIYFVQVFAVRPKDNIFVHTLPYYAFVLALWLMSFKHAVYFYDIRILESRILHFLLCIYIFLMLFTVFGKIVIGGPNLFGAKLWEQDGYEWTPTFSSINGSLHLFLTIPCPVIMYFLIIEKLDKITITINRDRIRRNTVAGAGGRSGGTGGRGNNNTLAPDKKRRLHSTSHTGNTGSTANTLAAPTPNNNNNNATQSVQMFTSKRSTKKGTGNAVTRETYGNNKDIPGVSDDEDEEDDPDPQGTKIGSSVPSSAL